MAGSGTVLPIWGPGIRIPCAAGPGRRTGKSLSLSLEATTNNNNNEKKKANSAAVYSGPPWEISTFNHLRADRLFSFWPGKKEKKGIGWGPTRFKIKSSYRISSSLDPHISITSGCYPVFVHVSCVHANHFLVYIFVLSMLIVLTVHIYTIRKIETRDKHLSAVYAPEKKGGGKAQYVHLDRVNMCGRIMNVCF